jgi:hypothetical protein
MTKVMQDVGNYIIFNMLEEALQRKLQRRRPDEPLKLDHMLFLLQSKLYL